MELRSHVFHSVVAQPHTFLRHFFGSYVSHLEVCRVGIPGVDAPPAAVPIRT